MKKNYLNAVLAAGVAAAALPAMALLPTNYNTVLKAPAISGEFARPQTQAEADAAKKASDSGESSVLREPQAAPVRATKAVDGTPLPSIVASVYDYSTGSIAMYRLPDQVGGEMTKLSDVSSYYGGALRGQTYFACNDGRYSDYWDTDSDPHGHTIQGYNIDTWQPIGNSMYFSTYRSSDLAIHPTTGKGYAFCDYGAMMYHLYELDLDNGTQTDLMPNASMMPEETSRALAFNSEGVLYGVTRSGKFGVVNLTTGRNSGDYDLGLTGSAQYGWTADFDSDTGNFIFIYNGNNISRIYSINPANGATTELASFTGKCITSMYIASDPVAAGAPAAVTDLSANFANGSLTGTVTFTMPTTLYDGSAASGTASWKVSEGNDVLASGTATYGAQVTANVTVTEAGKHPFSVLAYNDAGNGKKERINTWVGPDVPKAPQSVTVEFNETENLFNVSWTGVTEGANDGYIDPEAVRYTVTRQPGNVVVAENTADLSLACNYVPQGIESVTFTVKATQGSLTSEGTTSDPVVTGTLALPYDMTKSSNYLDNWTVINANGDNSTWEFSYSSIVYSYDKNNQADDWIISPPIAGYAGCKYTARLRTYCSMASYPEKLEVLMGSAPTVEAMKKTIVPPTSINQTSSNPQTIEFEIIPDADGKFFIGIHAISDADMYKLSINGLTISAPVSSAAPAAVTGLTLTADRSGALSVTGKGTAPSLTSTGTTLPFITRIDIMRDGNTVATVDNPTPGAEFTFSDTNIDVDGLKSYTAVAYTGDMAGNTSEATEIYVGVNRPGELYGIQIAETAEGDVHVTWDPLEKDWLGYPQNGDVTYSVEVYPNNAYYHGNKTYSGITETSYTFTPEFSGGATNGFIYVKVWATSSKGDGYGNKSANIPVGTPCTLPFSESFPNYTLEHNWGDGESNGPKIASITDDERSIAYQQFNGWNRLMDRSFNSAYTSQDNDNGFAGMFGWSYVEDDQGNYHNEWTELISPKISLTGQANPVLTFYTFNWFKNGVKDTNELTIDVLCDGVRTTVKDFVIGSLGTTEGWEFVAADLSQFAGKTINLIFTGTIKANGDNGYNWVLIDNIDINSVAGIDVAVDGIVAPVAANPGEEFTVKAKLTNLGGSDIASPKVSLLKNGETVAEKVLPTLPFSTSTDVVFKHTLSVNDPIGCVMQIVAEADGDENTDNNASATATVGRNLMLLPEPQSVRLGEANTIEWNAPDMDSAVPAPFTDDFEDYGDCELTGLFTTEAGDWIFIDVDQAPIGGIISASTYEMIEFPGIPTHSTQSWWVQSRLFEEFNNDYYGYSGMQYLANMYVVNNAFNRAVQQDDWAISPLLCGKEQMISLMARSYDRYTPETIELLWSDGSTNPADFTLARRIEAMSGDWTQYVFVVPEGARRFAIRGCSYAEGGTNQTFVDDVTFVPADGEPLNLKLLGYNVYCDNTCLTAAPTTNLSQALENYDANRVYSVSAVYDKGESRAVRLGETALDEIANGKVSVSTEPGLIIIDGMDGDAYTVVNPAGITLAASASASGRTTVAAPTGIYLVKVNGTIYKIAVK